MWTYGLSIVLPRMYSKPLGYPVTCWGVVWYEMRCLSALEWFRDKAPEDFGNMSQSSSRARHPSAEEDTLYLARPSLLRADELGPPASDPVIQVTNGERCQPCSFRSQIQNCIVGTAQRSAA